MLQHLVDIWSSCLLTLKAPECQVSCREPLLASVLEALTNAFQLDCIPEVSKKLLVRVLEQIISETTTPYCRCILSEQLQKQ